MKDNKLTLGITIIVLVILGILLFRDKGDVMTEGLPTGTDEVMEGETMDAMEQGEAMKEGAKDDGAMTDQEASVREFSVEGVPFSFTPDKIEVNQGDTVKITFRSKEGNHDLKVDEFGVGTRVLKAGEEETITFVADKTGTFPFYCSVANHRVLGMVGTIVVK